MRHKAIYSLYPEVVAIDDVAGAFDVNGLLVVVDDDAVNAEGERLRVEQCAADVRAERDWLLAACDWTQVSDAPVDAAAWAVYRQALRDVPTQPGFPEAVEWPVAPNAGV